MEQIRLVIAENDENHRKELVNEWRGYPGIIIAGETGDGHEAIRLVREQKPHLLICNMILRSYDAPAMLEQLKAEGVEIPKTIVISSIHQEGAIEKAYAAGADEYMLKPLNKALLLNRAAGLLQCPELLLRGSDEPQTQTEEQKKQHRREQLYHAVSALFMKIGIPAHLFGFRFAQEAVMMLVENPNLMRGRTKVLYPVIAKRNATSAFCVERAIRHAIAITWTRGFAERFEKEYGRALNLHLPMDRPSVGEFIALIAEYFRHHHTIDSDVC